MTQHEGRGTLRRDIVVAAKLGPQSRSGRIQSAIVNVLTELLLQVGHQSDKVFIPMQIVAKTPTKRH